MHCEYFSFILPYMSTPYKAPVRHFIILSKETGLLVAQLVKNPPAMQETWVQSLGGEDTLEKGKATHSSILTWRIPWIVVVCGVAKSRQG